jgi:hypothetical protein
MATIDKQVGDGFEEGFVRDVGIEIDREDFVASRRATTDGIKPTKMQGLEFDHAGHCGWLH